KEQHRENGRRQSDMELGGTADRMDDEVGLRIGQEEQADPGRPQYPPCHVVCAKTIRKPTAESAQYPCRKGKARGQKRSLSNAQPVLTHKVLRHPNGQRGEAAKNDRVILAVLPDAQVLEYRQLLAQ